MAEKKPGDRFTADKFRWFEQITADHELTPLCFHVAFKISGWIKRETREGWRSQEHLAVDCGVTVNGVRGALKQLCARGHLTILTGGGRGHASVYKFILKPTEKTNDGCTLIEEKEQQPLPLSQIKGQPPFTKGATTVHERGNHGSHKGATTVAPNPLSKSFKESLEYISPKKKPTKKSKLDVSEDFQEFWINYPRREEKKSAQKAYEKARLIATRVEILSGAIKHSAARQNQDPTFTKLPATWLNKECWTNEPQTLTQNQFERQKNGFSNPKKNSIDASCDVVSASLRAEREAINRDEAREAGTLGTSRYGFQTDVEIIP